MQSRSDCRTLYAVSLVILDGDLRAVDSLSDAEVARVIDYASDHCDDEAFDAQVEAWGLAADDRGVLSDYARSLRINGRGILDVAA